MPLKRSRPKTEQKFQDAVLELVAQNGCGSLGINAVAQTAGSDKVLIYRYFGDFDGLLKTVAESRSWVPDYEDVLAQISSKNPRSILQQIDQAFVEYFQTDPCLLELLRWRRADKSPLGKKFSGDWHSLWEDIQRALSRDLDASQRLLWTQICGLLSLMIEAKLCGDAVELSLLDRLIDQATSVELEAPDGIETVEAETLPTNLL